MNMFLLYYSAVLAASEVDKLIMHDGNPVRSSISLIITWSIEVILMIERMLHHEGMQLFNLSYVHCKNLGFL